MDAVQGDRQRRGFGGEADTADRGRELHLGRVGGPLSTSRGLQDSGCEGREEEGIASGRRREV